MTGAIFCETRPAMIIKSAWRGDGRKPSEPKRATSKRDAAIDIISIAQHASPKPKGQMELLRAQFTALSSWVKMIPSSCSRLPKSSGLVRVTFLPADVLMGPRFQHYFLIPRHSSPVEKKSLNKNIALGLTPRYPRRTLELSGCKQR